MKEAFKYGRLVIIVLQYMKIENPYSLLSIRDYVRPFGAHSASHGYQFVRIIQASYIEVRQLLQSITKDVAIGRI